jgi:SNF2 family DNA or RNA helicase
MPIQLKTRLHKHQHTNLAFHLERERSGDWSEMGTGKTLTALAKIVAWKRAGLIDRTLVVCPASVMPVWETEVRKHTTLQPQMLMGSLDQKIELLHKFADIYIVTYDSIAGRKSTYAKLLGALLGKGFDFLIGDEVAPYAKGKDALRTRAFTILCDEIPYAQFLAGYLIGNDPTQVFTIYRALDKSVFGGNFFASRNKFFMDVGGYFPKWELKDSMKDEFMKRIFSLAVRSMKRDCLDLPPKIWSERYFTLAHDQAEVYTPITEELIKQLELEEGNVNVSHALTKMAKLSQITSGFVYTDNNVHVFNNNPKLDVLNEILEQVVGSGEKLVIYFKYKQSREFILQLLKKRKINYIALSDDPSKRGEQINGFQNDSSRSVFLASVLAGGYGLTLTASHVIVYFDLDFKIIDFAQSQDRIHRIGQTKTCLYLPLLCQGGIDEYIYALLNSKLDIAESIMNSDRRSQLIKRLKGGING